MHNWCYPYWLECCWLQIVLGYSGNGQKMLAWEGRAFRNHKWESKGVFYRTNYFLLDDMMWHQLIVPLQVQESVCNIYCVKTTQFKGSMRLRAVHIWTMLSMFL